MDRVATIKKRWCWGGHQWWAWLRRSGALPLLLLLIVLRVGDPLTCVTHCRAWAQQDLNRTFAARHHSQPAAFLGGAGTELNHLRPIILANLFICFIDSEHGSPADMPYAPSATPFHEHQSLLVTVTFLVLVLLIQRPPRLSAPAAPQLAPRPLLRPPIPLAA